MFRIFRPVEVSPPRGSTTVGESSTTGDISPENGNGTGLLPEGLEYAFVPLTYSEGFPTLPDGLPFWDQLDFEPSDVYLAFRGYLDRGRMGARQLSSLEGAPDIPESVATLKTLQESFHLYYWKFRARAYDMFELAALRRARERRALLLEDDHYFVAQRLMKVVKLYLMGDEFRDLLTPKVALDALKTVVQLQRISSGLPAHGPAEPDTKEPPAPAASFEVILRNLVDPRDEKPIIDGDTGKVIMERALQDPETASLAQELVIRLNSGNR